MASPGRVGVIGDDVMLRSRVLSALGAIPSVVFAADATPAEGIDALFVDLNRDAGVRIAAVARWRAAIPEVTIVGFCSHGEMEIRRQAMAAGANRVVTNGGLAADARRVATGGVEPEGGNDA